MISCKGCPFLADVSGMMLLDSKDREVFFSDEGAVCALGYYVIRHKDSYCCPSVKHGCKLSTVIYSLKNRKKTLSFRPEKIND